MYDYIKSLEGSQVRAISSSTSPKGKSKVELVLFKEGKSTILTLEDDNNNKSCRWMDDRLVVLGHLASLLYEVVTEEMVVVNLISVEEVHGKFQDSGGARSWAGLISMVLIWRGYKVYVGDTEGDEILVSGMWPPHIKFAPGAWTPSA